MSLEFWQEIPAVPEDDRNAFFSPLTDFDLAEGVISNLDLTHAGFSIELASFCRSYKDGRIVATNPLKPEAIYPRIEELPAGIEVVGTVRWFRASDYILRLAGEMSQHCYGSISPSFGLTIFEQ